MGKVIVIADYSSATDAINRLMDIYSFRKEDAEAEVSRAQKMTLSGYMTYSRIGLSGKMNREARKMVWDTLYNIN